MRIKSGTYIFKKGKIIKKEKEYKFLKHDLIDTTLLISFCLGFILEILFYIGIKAELLYEDLMSLYFTIIYCFINASLIVSLVISIFKQLNSSNKKGLPIILLLCLSLLFFNINFFLGIIAEFSGTILTNLDCFIYFFNFSMAILLLLMTLIVSIMRKIKVIKLEKGRKLSFILRISNLSIGIILTIFIAILLNSGYLLFMGKLSFPAQVPFENWNLKNLLINIAIYGSIPVIVGIIIWKRREIFGYF